MYEKVLVPLDGSEVAEATLSHVRQMVQAGCVKKVVLLNVMEMPSFWITESVNVEKVVFEQRKRTVAYLENVQSRLYKEGIKAETVLLEGRQTAHMIVTYAKENNFDLIVIASHGYSGVMKWVFGSVALKVLHDSHIPILLIRPTTTETI